MKKLSVIMPGYNEGQKIRHNLIHTATVLDTIAKKNGAEYEIIFVNDGSTDDTNQYAFQAALINENIIVIDNKINCGKGNALKCGTERATGDYIVFLDSDLDLPPEQIEDFIERMDRLQCDVVIGSKQHPESRTDYPKSRKVMSYIYYMILVVLFRLKTKDTQTGIKLFKSEVIQPVMRQIQVNGYAYDIEVLAIINKLGYSIADAPVILNYQRESSWGRIKLSQVVRTGMDTLKIFFRVTFLFDREEYSQ